MARHACVEAARGRADANIAGAAHSATVPDEHVARALKAVDHLGRAHARQKQDLVCTGGTRPRNTGGRGTRLKRQHKRIARDRVRVGTPSSGSQTLPHSSLRLLPLHSMSGPAACCTLSLFLARGAAPLLFFSTRRGPVARQAPFCSIPLQTWSLQRANRDRTPRSSTHRARLSLRLHESKS